MLVFLADCNNSKLLALAFALNEFPGWIIPHSSCLSPGELLNTKVNVRKVELKIRAGGWIFMQNLKIIVE